MYVMLVTFRVSNDFRSRRVAPTSENILDILLTLDVLSDERSRLDRLSQSLNIHDMSVALEVSIPSKSIEEAWHP